MIKVSFILRVRKLESTSLLLILILFLNLAEFLALDLTKFAFLVSINLIPPPTSLPLPSLPNLAYEPVSFLIKVFNMKVSRVAIWLKLLMNCWKKLVKQINTFILWTILSSCHFFIASLLWSSILTPWTKTTYPRNFTSS